MKNPNFGPKFAKIKAPIRLNRYLAMAGLGSRRATEKLILSGKVFVNNLPASVLYTKVTPGADVVSLKVGKQRKILSVSVKVKVFILNKPRGYITSKRDPLNKSLVVYELLPQDQPGLKAVGRLDIQTSGLLLFSNNGDLIYRLTHPSYEIPKTYLVKLDRSFSFQDLIGLKKGVIIDGRKTLPPQIFHLNKKKHTLKIVLKEGRNREIRKLFKSIGFEVVDLFRTHFGPIKIGNLNSSEGRFLNNSELTMLLKSVNLD